MLGCRRFIGLIRRDTQCSRIGVRDAVNALTFGVSRQAIGMDSRPPGAPDPRYRLGQAGQDGRLVAGPG